MLYNAVAYVQICGLSAIFNIRMLGWSASQVAMATERKNFDLYGSLIEG